MSSDKSYRALRAIWEKVSVQAPDGRRYLIFKSKEDLEYLYCTGFVDEAKYPCEEWVNSFPDSLTPIGAYMVSEDQWMDKVKYHYSGPVGVPFDPMELREGDWAEEEMQKLIREKILPSIFFTAEEFQKILDESKKRGLLVDGKYRITKAIKEDLLGVLNEFPSPRRARELAVAEARQSAVGAPASARPTSGYEKGIPASQQAAEKLRDLLSKSPRKF